MSGGRQYPRVFLALHAELWLPDGSSFSGCTDNVSCAGFQIRAPAEAVSCLFPDSYQPAPRHRKHVQVALCGDAEGRQPVAVETRCAAVVGRRVAESVFHIGFQFLDLTADQLVWLEARIASGLRRGAQS